MVKLMVDCGNRFTKLAVFEDKRIVSAGHVPNESISLKRIVNIIGSQSIPSLALVSDVSATGEKVADLLRQKNCRVFTGQEITDFPLKVSYKTPETLGFDRIAAACGAHFLAGTGPLLVMDAGTALTVDLVNHRSVYCGGSISPGLSMRFEAMHRFTGKLPLGNAHPEMPVTGTSTMECLNAGAYWGMVFEIQGIINHYSARYKKLKLFMTGGDSRILQIPLKKPIFAEPNLVLTGLNEILDHFTARA